MLTFTYIIFSKTSNLYYKGITQSPQQRLFEHNNNLSRYTAHKGPWELVYLKDWNSKKEAIIEEKRLKQLNKRSLERLINNYRSLNV